MNALLVTDLSEAGLRSVEGIASCGASGFDRVTLLHVIDLDLYTAGGSVPQISDWATGALAAAAEPLRESGFEVVTRIEVGPAVETIVSVSEEIGADLIVTTNLGKGALAGRLLGSTAERLAAQSTRPVLIERAERTGETWCRVGTSSPFGTVVAGVDFEHDPSTMLRALAGLPGLTGLALVNVAKGSEDQAQAEERLAALAPVAPPGVAFETSVRTGDPADELLAEARARDATAVAVSPHGDRAVRRALLGSVSRKVAIRADRAVLFVPQR